MKKIKRLSFYLLPLLLIFSAMVTVNEYARGTIYKNLRSTEYMKMNSAVATPEACTWNCYNDTGYCKRNHVKLANSYFAFIDPFYFGMINALMMVGNYGVANVLFLVILWPLLMSYLLVKPLLIQIQLKQIMKRYD